MSEDAPQFATSEEGNQVPVRYEGDSFTQTDAEGKSLLTGEDLSPGSPLVGENYEHNPDKAYEVATAEHSAQSDAARERRYAAQNEESVARDTERQREYYRERVDKKQAEADTISQRAANIYDLRDFLKNQPGTEVNLSPEASKLHDEILEEARKTYSEIDKSGFIGYATTLGAIEKLLQLGDRQMLIEAIDIIENPKSEHFTASYGRGEQHKNIAYQDLVVAAYEGGLVEEAQRLEPLITWEEPHEPIIFAKAWALDSAIPELLEQVSSSAPHIQAEFSRLTVRKISEGKIEIARQLAEKLRGERKFRALAKLVESGDKDSLEAARQAATELSPESGDNKSGSKVRALLRLYEAGDDDSLPTAMEIIRNSEWVEGRLDLLVSVDEAVKRRSEQNPEPPQAEQLAA